LISEATVQGAVKIIYGIVDPAMDGMKKLREMADRIKQKEPSSVAILGVNESETNKPFLVVAVGPQVKVVAAGDVIKASADKFGGKGGGKPDFAQAGGTKSAGLGDAIAAAKQFVVSKLK
jgi:alanyl-tRNA synthetase